MPLTQYDAPIGSHETQYDAPIGSHETQYDAPIGSHENQYDAPEGWNLNDVFKKICGIWNGKMAALYRNAL